MATELISIRFSDDIAQSVRNLAKEEGYLSTQELVREIVRNYLRAKTETYVLKELDKLAGSAKGKGRRLTAQDRDEIVAEMDKRAREAKKSRKSP